MTPPTFAKAKVTSPLGEARYIEKSQARNVLGFFSFA